MEVLPDDKLLFEEDIMLGHACFNQAGTNYSLPFVLMKKIKLL